MTHVVVSIDTEEDNWAPTRDGITVENIRHIPRFHSFLRGLGVKPTYFTNYSVSRTPWAAEILRGVAADGNTEIGAHLHPWNTPPLEEEHVGRNTMTKNLPSALQAKKLEVLTEQHREAFGAGPSSFRAGRFGMGASLLPALISLGYNVDSSVTPYFSWAKYDDGPDFHGATNNAYRVGRHSTDITRHDPSGELVELPVSVGFSRRPFNAWSRVHRTLDSRYLRPLRLNGAAARSNLVQKVVLTPEMGTAADLLLLSRRLIEDGVTHLQMFLHSSSLQAGLSAFTPTTERLNKMVRNIEGFIEGVQKLDTIEFSTVTEAALRCCPGGGQHAGR